MDMMPKKCLRSPTRGATPTRPTTPSPSTTHFKVRSQLNNCGDFTPVVGQGTPSTDDDNDCSFVVHSPPKHPMMGAFVKGMAIFIMILAGAVSVLYFQGQFNMRKIQSLEQEISALKNDISKLGEQLRSVSIVDNLYPSSKECKAISKCAFDIYLGTVPSMWNKLVSSYSGTTPENYPLEEITRDNIQQKVTSADTVQTTN